MQIVRILFALPLLANQAMAEGDIFQQLSGTYGDALNLTETCEHNPQHLVFSQDNKSGELRVYARNSAGAALSDLELMLTLSFSVLNLTSRGIQITFANEETRTGSGALVEWEFRPLSDPDGLCWHRTDWPVQRCDFTSLRCEEFALTS